MRALNSVSLAQACVGDTTPAFTSKFGCGSNVSRVYAANGSRRLSYRYFVSGQFFSGAKYPLLELKKETERRRRR